MLRTLSNRISNVAARAVVWMADDSKMLQQVQVSLQAREVRNAERFQQYGFTSVPLPESEAVLLFPGGMRDHALAIAVDDRRHRPTDWEQGEVGLYTHEGDLIRMRAGRIIEVVCGTKVDVTAPEVVVHASTKVRLETPMLECTGEIKDRCDSDGKTMEQMRTAYDAHNHGNVQNGGGVTAGPTPTVG
jgi:phage baseplate assembly protein V